MTPRSPLALFWPAALMLSATVFASMALLASRAAAESPPPGEANANTYCQIDLETQSDDEGPSPTDVRSSCGLWDAGPRVWAYGSGRAGFGGVGDAPGGHVDADGTANAESILRSAVTIAGANVRFFISIEPTVPPPGGTPPSEIPLVAQIRGRGTTTVVGPGSSASVFGTIAIAGEGAFFSGEPGSFDESIALDLPPGTLAEVGAQAACRADAWFPENTTTPAYARCHARVDPPEIAFDQATFDARMGGGTYPLADYFEIVYSPNAVHAVPIGAFASGLTLLSLLGVGCRSLARREAPASSLETPATAELP